MSQEQIIDALEFIDDDMIESVNVLRKYPERHKHLWLNYVAVAACIMLAIFGGFNYLGNNVSTENNSSANNGGTNQMNDAADTVGGAENKIESADQITQDDNSSFRDEFAGSTSSTENTGSSTEDICFAASVYIEITEISDNSFKGKVLKKAVVGNSTHFEENQIVTVIYSESTNEKLDTLLIKDLSVGEKVYVFYGKIESGTIYTSRIQYEKF
ncbi:MAG: hypothetical protein E7528_01905 [Ruminococcaceae bacterium]|nr:hypothetical protein [Oscillospiraceae bacterium]